MQGYRAKRSPVCSFGFAHLKKDLHTLLIVVVLTLLSDFRLVTSFLFILY